MDASPRGRMGYEVMQAAANVHICTGVDAQWSRVDISSIYHGNTPMKCGSLIVIRSDRLIAEDSMMPLWGSLALMDTEMLGGNITMDNITGWMGPDDTATVIELRETSSSRHTPIIRVLVSRSGGGIGWIDSVYCRCMQ